MFIYEYSLRALDFVYFARKSLVGDVTPSYIHSTALNAAVQSVLNLRTDEKYITDNVPDYEKLFKDKNMYLTPARPVSVDFINQGITSNPESYIFQVKAGEILRFQPIRIATPGSIWGGFLISREKINEKALKIRLGRGKSLAQITFKMIAEIEDISEGIISTSHVGDPLNYEIKRGFLINTLPYPLVENPTIDGKYVTVGNKIIGIPMHLDVS